MTTETQTTDVLFGQMGLPLEVLKGIEAAGFEKCTAIQAMALPITLQGHDIAAQAQTGTGKTATFLITAFTRLLEAGPSKGRGPRVLVIAPTRELTVQISEEAKLLGGYTDFSVLPIFGGMDYVKQQEGLRSGADIVVATPGRLIDYMRQKVFSPSQVRIVVVDEADRMFDMGFVRDLRYILKRLPPYQKRQSMLFSATLSYGVMELAYEYMNNPHEVFAAPEKITVDEIDQIIYHVGNDEKLNLLLGLLKRESWNRVLVFANTRREVEVLERKLEVNGYAAVGITGTVPQKKRLRIMQQFKAGKVKILVATDVASRGIHVEDIDIVINYDIPQDSEDYVHRIGRTGRAGKAGRAISLACETYVYYLEAVEKFLGEKIKVGAAEEDWLEEDRDKAPRVKRKRKRIGPARQATRTSQGERSRRKSPPRARRSPARASQG